MKRRAAWLALLLGPFVGAAWLSPHAPEQQYREYANQPPRCGEPCFLLGSDGYGRDVWSRTLHGGRASLLAGAGATLVALLLGGVLGAAAGFAPRWGDELLSRPIEVLFSVPWFYLLLALRAALPLSAPGEQVFALTMLTIGVAGLGGPFRLARQKVRQCRQSDAVRAAAGLGVSGGHIFRAHLLPATLGPLGSLGQTLYPQFVLAEVGLSFLGLGGGEGMLSWGSTLAPLREYSVLTRQWWMFAPVVALALVMMALSWGRGSEEEER